MGLLGTIKGVDRKASGEGATRSEEFLYIKREFTGYFTIATVLYLFFTLKVKISKSIRQILLAISQTATRG